MMKSVLAAALSVAFIAPATAQTSQPAQEPPLVLPSTIPDMTPQDQGPYIEQGSGPYNPAPSDVGPAQQDQDNPVNDAPTQEGLPEAPDPEPGSGAPDVAD